MQDSLGKVCILNAVDAKVYKVLRKERHWEASAVGAWIDAVGVVVLLNVRCNRVEEDSGWPQGLQGIHAAAGNQDAAASAAGAEDTVVERWDY